VADNYARGDGVVDAVVYAYGKYYGLTPALERQGFTVRKPRIPDGG